MAPSRRPTIRSLTGVGSRVPAVIQVKRRSLAAVASPIAAATPVRSAPGSIATAGRVEARGLIAALVLAAAPGAMTARRLSNGRDLTVPREANPASDLTGAQGRSGNSLALAVRNLVLTTNRIAPRSPITAVPGSVVTIAAARGLAVVTQIHAPAPGLVAKSIAMRSLSRVPSFVAAGETLRLIAVSTRRRTALALTRRANVCRRCCPVPDLPHAARPRTGFARVASRSTASRPCWVLASRQRTRYASTGV